MDGNNAGFLSLLFDQAFEPVIVRRLDGLISGWNRGAVELYGYSRDEAIGAISHDLLNTVFPVSLSDINQRLVRDGRWIGELVHAARSGQRITVESRQQLFLQPDGTQLVLETNRDLSASELQFSEMFEQSSVAMCLVEPEVGGLLRVNHRFCELTGYSEKELVGCPFADFIHPDDRTSRHEGYWQLLRGEIAEFSMEKRYVRKNGSVFMGQIKANLMRDAAGRRFRVLVVVEDITARRLAELALRVANQRLEHVLSASPTVIYSCRPSGDYGATYISPNVTRVTGYEPDEFTSDSSFWNRHIHPDDAQQVFSNLPKLFESGSHLHEYRFRRKDGSYGWMQDELRLMRDAHGQPIEIIGTWRDITARKQAETALRESEQKFSVIFEKAPFAISLTHMPDGSIAAVNNAFVSLFGHEREEVIGKTSTMLGISDPDSQTRVRAELGKTGTVRDLEAIRTTKSGASRNLALNLDWVDIAGERYILTTIRDITEHKRNERALLESEWRYRSLADLSPDAILVNQDGRYVYANPAAVRLAGAKGPGDILGRSPLDLLEPKYHDVVGERLRIVLDEKRHAPPIEYRLNRLDGSPVDIEVIAGPIMWDGRPAVQVMARDITERKQEEQAREQRHEEELARLYRIGTVNELAGGLAHELSQPLTAIQNYVGGVLKWVDAGGNPQEIRRALEEINTQSARMVDIIHHLRRLMSDGEPQRAPASLNEIVRRACELLKVPLARKNVRLDLELAPDLPEMFVDSLQIEQVVIILLRNCIDAFSGEYLASPAVEVRTAVLPGAAVEVTVSDNGPGVAPDVLRHMFEPFYTTKVKGMGLGLMLARSIVRSHNGAIEARPPANGTGLSVRFTLPADRGADG